MTQEELAEKITVTRQAVSNWETGKTRPDIDMLEAISSALGAEMSEILYGKKANEPEKRDTRIYKKLAVISGAAAIVLFAALLISAPYIENYVSSTYDTRIYNFALAIKPITVALFSVCVLSVISIKADIHIKNHVLKNILFALGIIFLLFLLLAKTYLLGIKPLFPDILVIRLDSKPILFSIPAVLIYLGSIKR